MEYSAALSLLSNEVVQTALTVDKGKEAKLESWESVPFTKKGDNYASFVTSIQVKFKKCNQTGQISYVVKLNPCDPDFEWPQLIPPIFEKEGKFYLEVLPVLNKFMKESHLKDLPFPMCYYAQYVKGKEIIILEDLRIKGFKMIDRRKGMDLHHAILVIQCLGRFHAASSLMLKKYSMDDMKSKYPFLFHELWKGKFIDTYCATNLKSGKEMLIKDGGQGKAVKWLDKQLPNMQEFFAMNYASVPPFNAICHGDCWSNNILFRYDETGSPVEAMLLDMQSNRVASLATDLNHFMMVSLEGSVRKPNVGRLLTEYYNSYSSVIEGCGQDLAFNEEELVYEFKKKNAYGLIIGTIEHVFLKEGMEEEDNSDLENRNVEKIEDSFLEGQENAGASLDHMSPVCETRIIAMYDEMSQNGLFT